MIIAALLLAAANPAPATVTPAPGNPPSVSIPPPPVKGSPPKPANSPGGWVLAADYPPAAVAERRACTTRFKVTVAPDGIVTGCDIVLTSGSDDLDNATCALIATRALFTPAEDENGKPIFGTYTNSIKWVLPAPDPVPPPADAAQ